MVAVVTGARAVAPTAGCAFSVDAISKALRGYAAEHEGRLPAAERWQTDLRPYYERARAEAGPAAGALGLAAPDEPWGCGAGPERTGLVFNSLVGGRKIAEMERPEQQVVVFERPGSGTDRSAAFEPREVGPSPRVAGATRAWFGISARLNQLEIREGGSVREYVAPASDPADHGMSFPP